MRFLVARGFHAYHRRNSSTDWMIMHPYFTQTLEDLRYIVVEEGGAELAPRPRRVATFRVLVERMYASNETVHDWPLWDMTGMWRHINVQAIIDTMRSRRATVLRNFHRYGFSVRWTHRTYGDTREPALYVQHPALRKNHEDWTQVMLGTRVRDSTLALAATAAAAPAPAAAATALDSAAAAAEPVLL